MATWEEMIELWPELADRNQKDFHQHRYGGWAEETATVENSRIEDGSLVLGTAHVSMCIIKNSSIIKDRARAAKSTLSDYVRVEDNAFIDQSIIAQRSTVKDNAKVVRSTVYEKSTIRGNCTLLQCVTFNSTLEGYSVFDKTIFKKGIYTAQPVTINEELLGYSININKDTIDIGCMKKPIEWWKESAKKIWKEYTSYVKKQNVDKVVEAIRLLQEVYKDNNGD